MLAPAKLDKVAWMGLGLVTSLNVVTAPAGMVLVKLPFTFMVTRKLITQLLLGGSSPSLKVNESEPETPVSFAFGPHNGPGFKSAGVAMIMPAGRKSVKVIPVRGELFGFEIVTLNVDAAPP